MRKEFRLADPYENQLQVYLWETTEKVKGIVQILHGAGEHMGRYDDFAQYLNTLGFTVIGNDHLGHGKNNLDKDYVYFDNTLGFHKVYEGVKTVRKYIEENYPKKPVIMFAHSMGSFIGRYAIIHDHHSYDQAVFSGTGSFSNLNITFGRIVASIITLFKGKEYVSEFFNHRILDGHIRAMKRNGLINDRSEWISQRMDIQKDVLNDPLCNKEFTIGAQKDILTFLPEIQNNRMIKGSSSATAIYFVSGSQDGLGKFGEAAKKLYQLYDRCGYSNVKYTILNNCRHEIINEVDYEGHYQLIGNWMLNNL